VSEGASKASGERTEARRQHRMRAFGAVAAALVFVVLSMLPVTARADPSPSPSASSSSGSPNSAASGVTITLKSMTPRSPDALNLTQPVTFTATVTNNGATAYLDFTVGLERGLPINQQHQLDAAIATPPPTNTLQDSHEADEHRPLPPHSSVDITYHSTPASDQMCLCTTAVYPFALVVHALNDQDAGFTEVARTQILVPAFLEPSKPVQVSWIWPLIDRPHRSLSDTVFDDDQLAASVSAGGRLYRALQVAMNVQGHVRLTLLVDPDLLDSLSVMASPAGYQYKSGSNTVKGAGGPAAAAWLARLHSLIGQDDIVLTAYADPDINAVTRAGMPWSTALDPQVQARIASTISDFSTDLSWPADGTLTSKALDASISGGSSAVVLSDSALPGQNKAEPRPNALSPLPSATGRALALVTDSAIEKTVGQALKLGAVPAQAQQTLLGQLAIRALEDESSSHFVVIAPDRYVDTDPTTASDTILATTGNSWSTAIAVRKALTTLTPVDRGPLQTAAADPTAELSPSSMASLVRIQSAVASLREALTSSAAADLLSGFGAGIQRAQSSAWRADPAGQAVLIREMNALINKRLSSVFLVQPSNGTYSLSSSSSPVVVTVQNQLSRDVTVRVSVVPANGVLGFRAPPVEMQTILANSRKTISIPTHVDRLGKFQVIAKLTTPDGQQLGQSVQLNLRATSIGGITKTITIAAASVLILALLRRLVRRIRRGPAARPLATGAAT
jgi:hypothetical protein